MRASRVLFALVTSATIAFALAACDLNPQPLPPGDQADGSANPSNGATGSSGGGGSLASDAGVADTSSDASTGTPMPDGASEPASDGQSDAPVDSGDGAVDVSDASLDADEAGD